MSPQGAVLARFNATMAYAHVGAIASALDAETLAAGPGGQLWFSWGPYPVGVGYLDSKPSVRYPEWESGSEPQAMVLGADGRLWLSFTGAAANSSTGNYGFVDAANLTETAYTARQQVFGLTNGPGLDVSYVSMDNYLYEIATSVSAATASAGPSSIALSLPTPAQAFSKMVVVAASAVIAVGGVLFITFPANLFNLPFDENYEAIATWVARRRDGSDSCSNGPISRPLRARSRRLRAPMRRLRSPGRRRSQCSSLFLMLERCLAASLTRDSA